MAVSKDNNPGSWTTLNSGEPVLTSVVGMKGIRDPSLIISPDRSKFYLINTVCAPSPPFPSRDSPLIDDTHRT